MNLKGNLATFGFVLAILTCDTLATKWYMDVSENAQKPNMCYDKKMNAFFKVNESWRRPDACERISCRQGDEPGIMSLTGSTCPVPVSLPKNCHMVTLKPTADYPDCCPTVNCNGEPNGPVSMVG